MRRRGGESWKKGRSPLEQDNCRRRAWRPIAYSLRHDPLPPGATRIYARPTRPNDSLDAKRRHTSALPLCGDITLAAIKPEERACLASHLGDMRRFEVNVVRTRHPLHREVRVVQFGIGDLTLIPLITLFRDE